MLRRGVAALLHRIPFGFCIRRRNVLMRTITVFCAVEKLSSREAAQKTILLDSAPPHVVLEKVSLSLQAPGKVETSRPPSDLSDTSTANSSFTCAQLVEQKLQEITQEAENLAAAAIKNLTADEHTSQTTASEVSSTIAESEGYRTPEQTLRIEITSPVLKASQSFSRTHHLGSIDSQRNLPQTQRVTDLKSIAEATQRLFDEAKGMSRAPPLNPEKNRESLADRLSKGIHELTQGSSDRLQRWKTKLQAGGHGRRQKDQSEPPPMRRPPMLVDTDPLSEWSDRYPRPLHPSRSASNALQINHINSMHGFG
ncbi:hypothetical protein Aduo_019444 [Ancylostoma duodenale]